LQEELLTLLLEEVSVIAAGFQRKKPLRVPRPDDARAEPENGVKAQGFRNVAKLAMAQGRVRASG
jgi:hypothetical protein